tara:strand:- start:965 stop:1138 length:174 start_codon:yes stop_codon:yes gene_type:complete
MNLKEKLQEKIKTRDERRKLILDPNIDQIEIVSISKGLRKMDREISKLIRQIENEEN